MQGAYIGNRYCLSGSATFPSRDPSTITGSMVTLSLGYAPYTVALSQVLSGANVDRCLVSSLPGASTPGQFAYLGSFMLFETYSSPGVSNEALRFTSSEGYIRSCFTGWCKDSPLRPDFNSPLPPFRSPTAPGSGPDFDSVRDTTSGWTSGQPPVTFACALITGSLPNLLSGSGTPYEVIGSPMYAQYTPPKEAAFTLDPGSAQSGPGIWVSIGADAALSPAFQPAGAPSPAQVSGGCISKVAQNPIDIGLLRYYWFEYKGPPLPSSTTGQQYSLFCLWVSIHSSPFPPLTPNNATMKAFDSPCSDNPAGPDGQAGNPIFTARFHHFWRGFGRPRPSPSPAPSPSPSPPPPPTEYVGAEGMPCPPMPPSAQALIPALAGYAMNYSSSSLEPAVFSFSAAGGVAQTAQLPFRRSSSSAWCPTDLTTGPGSDQYTLQRTFSIPLACSAGTVTLTATQCYLVSPPSRSSPSLTWFNASVFDAVGPYGVIPGALPGYDRGSNIDSCVRVAQSSSFLPVGAAGRPGAPYVLTTSPPLPFCVPGSVPVPSYLLGRGTTEATGEVLIITPWGYVTWSSLPRNILRNCITSVVEKGNFSWALTTLTFDPSRAPQIQALFGCPGSTCNLPPPAGGGSSSCQQVARGIPLDGSCVSTFVGSWVAAVPGAFPDTATVSFYSQGNCQGAPNVITDLSLSGDPATGCQATATAFVGPSFLSLYARGLGAPSCEIVQRWGDSLYVNRFPDSASCTGRVESVSLPNFYAPPSGVALLPAQYVYSASASESPSATPTSTISASPTSSLPPGVSPSNSGSISLSNTMSGSVTPTSSTTGTPTPALSVGASPSKTSTASLSSSPTATPTATLSTGASPSVTATKTPYWDGSGAAAAGGSPSADAAGKAAGGSIGGLLLLAIVLALLRGALKCKKNTKLVGGQQATTTVVVTSPMAYASQGGRSLELPSYEPMSPPPPPPPYQVSRNSTSV